MILYKGHLDVQQLWGSAILILRLQTVLQLINVHRPDSVGNIGQSAAEFVVPTKQMKH